MKNVMSLDAVGDIDDDVWAMPVQPARSSAIDAATPQVSRVIAILLGWSADSGARALRAHVNTEKDWVIPDPLRGRA
jgi:hypothetical protein